MWVVSMALLSGLMVWHCCKPWLGWQCQGWGLGLSGSISDSTPSLGTSICRRGGCKKKKKNVLFETAIKVHKFLKSGTHTWSRSSISIILIVIVIAITRIYLQILLPNIKSQISFPFFPVRELRSGH